MIAPPHRPYRPVIARPHYRPTPPPAWRPRRGLPVIRGILGLTFGAAFNVSLDYLYNSGYTVDGYGNNIVYLRNVPAMNYIWTDGALYYGNGGLMRRASIIRHRVMISRVTMPSTPHWSTHMECL